MSPASAWMAGRITSMTSRTLSVSTTGLLVSRTPDRIGNTRGRSHVPNSVAEVTTVVLAHQGGWDEMLMVLVPILVFAALLVVANRRATRIEEQRQRDEGAGHPRDAGPPAR